jgi:hypothetical protein
VANPDFQVIFNDEIKRKIGFRLRPSTEKTAHLKNNIFIAKGERIAHQGGHLPGEGFEIVVEPDSIHIKGADSRGSLYGSWALLSMMEKQDGEWRVPCGIYRDWPDVGTRGISVEMLPPLSNDLELFKRYLLAFSKARANLVVFYHMPGQIQAWKDKTSTNGWSEEQMRKVAAFARSLEMGVWAGMSHKFRKKAHPGLAIQAAANLYDPFDARSYPYLYPYYDKLLSVYQPEAVLIGHDEIKGLNAYTANGKHSVAEAFAASVNTISEWFNRRRVGVAIWGDMLLDHEKWNESVGAANSGRQLFDSGATHSALDLLSRDVAIVDWHYNDKYSYPSIAYFAEKDFAVYGSGWYESEAAKHMAHSVKSHGAKGVIGTNWGFWRTLSPAATTLYSTLCGWNINCDVDASSDIRFFANEMRNYSSTEGLVQTPVSIEQGSNASTFNTGDRRAIFDTGGLIDLRFFSFGDLEYGRTRFNIAPHDNGKRMNAIVVGRNKQGRENPAAVMDISVVDKKCKSIRFLHTLFRQEPQYRSKILGVYRIEYVDGMTAQVEIIEGFNITDVRSGTGVRKNDWTFRRHPEILIGSESVWQGQSATGIPLNVQMLAWENPYPEKAIKRIQIQAKQLNEDFRIAVLGLTLIGP